MPTLISTGIQDHAGKRRTLAVFIEGTQTDVAIQNFIDDLHAELDAAIDGLIVDVSVSKAFDVPAGLKGAAVAGADVRQGALLSFDVANTDYRHSIYVPTWEEAGYSGDTVLNTGVYATFINRIVNGDGVIVFPTDQYDNIVSSYMAGRQTFRK